MPRYAAFLRGINIGNRRVKNDALRLACEGMGFVDVAIFRASGNVVLGTEGKNGPEEVTRRLEGGLEDSLGYEVAVFLRTAAQVRTIAGHEPFDAKLLEASTGKVQVSLLAEAPSAAARKRVLSLATAEDRLAIRGRELYWLPNGGISESALDLKAIGTALGLSTMRTKGTIDQIAAKHFA
jgi:uncharacterized protein (DUF1697 family)